MSQVDVLSYMIPSASFSKSFHMASKQPGVNPEYVLSQPVTATSGWIFYIKNPAGFPWDINFYDNQYVYQCITEGPQGWANPTSYKVFRSGSWPSNHGGIVWSPRYLEPAPHTEWIQTPDSTYQTRLNGSLVATQNLAHVQTHVQGPLQLAIGDLGMVNAIVQTYQWGEGYATQEVNYYAYGLGLVRWQEYRLEGGKYVLEIDNLFDQKRVGGTPALDFPNPLP